MRNSLFIIFQFAYVAFAQGQFPDFSQGNEAEVKTIDSLHNKFAEAKTNTYLVDLLNLLAKAYYQINKNNSLAYYSRQALELSQKTNYVKGILQLVYGSWSGYSEAAIMLPRLNLLCKIYNRPSRRRIRCLSFGLPVAFPELTQQ